MQDSLIIFGGSFDPPHLGHLRLALELHSRQSRCRIAFVPCAQNSIKANAPSSAEHRLKLLRLLLQPYPQFRLLDHELRAGGISSTVHSLQALRREHGAKLPILLLMGVDSYNSLPQWRRVQQLPQLCSLLVANRPGHQRAQLPTAVGSWQTAELPTALSASSGYICWLQLPEVHISSSALRQLLAQGRDTSAWLAPALQAYIKEQGLYGQ